MQNNSNNNLQGWKQRLDSFEEIPSEGSYLDASWEKLQQRRPVKRSNNKAAFLWLAAACITGISFLLFSNNEASIKPAAVVKADTLKRSPENKPLLFENEPLIFDNKKTITVNAEKIKKAPLPAPVIIKKEEESLPLLVVQTPDIPQSPAITDTGNLATIQVVTQAKKLKVVHINELYPQADTNGLAQQEGKPYFPFTYQSKQVYSNAAETDKKKGKDNLIRIKLN